jgi:hypothetical protein
MRPAIVHGALRPPVMSTAPLANSRRVMGSRTVKPGMPDVQMLSAIVPGASSSIPSAAAISASSATSTTDSWRWLRISVPRGKTSAWRVSDAIVTP